MTERTTGRFLAHRVAMEAAGSVLALLAGVRGAWGDLVDQARRAATSAALNVAEGAGRQGKARRNHYRIAYGSAREAATAIELLAMAGAVDAVATRDALDQLDRVRALTWRLTH